MGSADDSGRSQRQTARYTAAQFWLALIVAVVGFASAGFVGGRESAPIETVTETLTETVTVESNGVESPTSSGGQACAGKTPTLGDREPNNQAGQASGPIPAAEPFEGEIATTNDLDYFAVCVAAEAELQLAIECVEAPDEGCSTYASFGGIQTGAGDFEPGFPLGCTVSQPGRYYILVESNNYPVTYRITVDTTPRGVLVTDLPDRPLDVAREPCY